MKVVGKHDRCYFGSLAVIAAIIFVMCCIPDMALHDRRRPDRVIGRGSLLWYNAMVRGRKPHDQRDTYHNFG